MLLIRPLSQFLWAALTLVGWIAYGAVWVLFLRDPDPVPVRAIGLELGWVLAVLGVASAYWIVHNRRRAREGGRGGATRWEPWSYGRDGLGHAVYQGSGLEEADEVTVTVDGLGTKRFRREEAAR